MYCKHCGRAIDNDSRFCYSCGGIIDSVGQTIKKSIHIINPPEILSQSPRLPKYDLSYKRNYTPAIVGIILIFQISIFYYAIYNGQNALDYDNELVRSYLFWVFFILFIIRIIITGSIVAIAEKLNRNKTGWGFLAFFFPLISLFVIGFKRKLKSPQ